MLTVNGTPVDDAEGSNVTELLSKEGYPTKMIAVECNGEIIPRSKYEDYHFKDGDCVEVVRFVGGG